jgi:ubiquinone/menaquinone biosynthesis C-methylase UbiE
VRVQVLAEAARVCRGRLIVLDYDLPRARPLRAFCFWMIGLFESPYFRSFAREDALPLFADAGLPIPTVKRLFSGMFSVFTLSVT